MRVATFFLLFALFVSVFGLESAIEWSDDENYLNVFVVPHSHNDPGWWYTFEGYYTKWTKGIISSIVTALEEDSRRTFVWCETSFFSRWWADQDTNTKNTVKKLVQNNQLEFVGGGWVMNDEASVDLHQLINQYTAGHQWLLENIGKEAIPTTGWAIDPFGHSSAMAWIHREMGFDGMVINRVHEDIKTAWNKDQKLEFVWDRPWDMGNRSCLHDSANEHIRNRWEGDGMLTHMLAYKLYDIPNTCGPDWDVCAKFDFERPVSIPITPSNIEERSNTLLGQYRKKHKAFTHNNLLVPLGDDFKYKDIDMTRKMMENYQKMFDYMNNKKSLKVRIRFATLREYFDAVKHSLRVSDNLPRYDQDFFTYSDRDNEYWSGYYTTRPYLKKAIRTTESQLRSAQILFSVIQNSLDSVERQEAFEALKTCSETLGLLQHHDAITGTAKQVVANDYIELINNARRAVASVSSRALQYLACDHAKDNANIIRIQEDQSGKEEPKYQKISLSEDRSLVLFNTLSHEYQGIIKVLVDRCTVVIHGESGEIIPSQIVPVLLRDGKLATDQFWMLIQVSLSPLSWQTLQIAGTENQASISEVYSLTGESISFCKDFVVSAIPPKGFSLSLTNQAYTISIHSTNGQLKSIKRFNNEISMNQEYRTYQTRGGSYLFKPSGESTALDFNDVKSVLVRGALVDQVQSVSSTQQLAWEVLFHQSSLHALHNRIEILHHVDMSSTIYNNKELVARVSTGMSGNSFWTDSASLDMVERFYEKNRPIQANFYPATSLFTKRDSKTNMQLSVMLRHALGIGTRGAGQFDFMLDRRTMQDDARGMGEKVTDQAPVTISMWYTLEQLPSDSQDIDVNQAISMVPQLNYPPEAYFVRPSEWKGSLCSLSGALMQRNVLPDSVELFSMQPASAQGDKILFRFAHLNPFSGFQNFQFDLGKLFPTLSVTSVEEYTISTLHQLEKSVRRISLPSMSVRTYIANVASWKSFLSLDTQHRPNEHVQEEKKNSSEKDQPEIEGLLVEGDLPLLPGERPRNNERVHILAESLRNQIRPQMTSLPLLDYYLVLTCCCSLLVVLFIFTIRNRRKRF